MTYPPKLIEHGAVRAITTGTAVWTSHDGALNNNLDRWKTSSGDVVEVAEPTSDPSKETSGEQG